MFETLCPCPGRRMELCNKCADRPRPCLALKGASLCSILRDHLNRRSGHACTALGPPGPREWRFGFRVLVKLCEYLFFEYRRSVGSLWLTEPKDNRRRSSWLSCNRLAVVTYMRNREQEREASVEVEYCLTLGHRAYQGALVVNRAPCVQEALDSSIEPRPVSIPCVLAFWVFWSMNMCPCAQCLALVRTTSQIKEEHRVLGSAQMPSCLCIRSQAAYCHYASG